MTELAASGKRWARRGAWATAGVLVFWTLSWLAVPPLLKSQIERFGSDKLGRKVTLGAVEFRPWSLELTLHGLRVATADGKATQLSVKRLYLDAELQSLLRLAPVVDALALDTPVLQLTRADTGQYDIDDILQKLATPATAPETAPLRFALHKLSVTDGALDFTDAGRTHALRDLQLALPMLSNFASRRELASNAKLSFKLGGARFDTAAQATPFAPSRKTDATLRVTALDLAPYLAYLPQQLGLRLQTATLDFDLKLGFEKDALKLSGVLQASRVRLVDVRQQQLLDFDSLKLVLDEVQPLAHKAKLSYVELNGPHLSAVRDQAGRLNLAAVLVPASTGKGAAAEAGSATPAWQVSVAKFSLRGGSLDWSDASTARGKTGAAQVQLSALELDASNIVLPWTQPMAFSASAALASARTRSAPPATLQFDGTATDSAASVTARLSSVPLSLAAPYLAQYLVPTVGGTLDAELALDWQAGTDSGGAAALKVTLPRLALRKLNLTRGGSSLASVQSVEASGGQIDLGARSAALGKLALSRANVTLERGSDKRWMFDKWLQPAAAAAGVDRTAPGRKQRADVERRWSLAIADLLLTDSNVVWLDHAMAKPVQLDVSRLRVQIKPLLLPGKAPATLQIQAAIRSGNSEPGQLSYRGRFKLDPLSTQGSVDLGHFPLQALEPYFADTLNVELLRADTSFKGQASYADSAAGMRLQVSGDAEVADFRANNLAGVTPADAPASAAALANGDELLNWKILNMRGLELTLAPAQPTVMKVHETTLSDFYARIVIRDSGRINLQDLLKPATATTTEAKAGSAPPVFNFGPTRLLACKVLFTDQFIRPNYSADLSQLTGKLGAFSSVAPGGDPQMAALELRGRVQGTAALEIVGQINPLANPLALDIKASARDLELPPLSPYSVRYAGYGIERGKLSMDVSYKVLADGQLSASNKLVLNQLAFGDRVENAPASLPVKLAVALLADRNGMIDIDLPISGSINDPQFRIGPLIFKMVINLIGKAITAPFSLLANASGGGGGGDEHSTVNFTPGSAALTAGARQSLDQVAKALNQRPALKLTVVGMASLEVERAGYQRERLDALVLAQKRRAVLSDSALSSAASSTLVVNPSEYPALLKEVYRQANMPKPRSLIGIAKDIEPGEMEALLLANITVTDKLMHELAVQRGVVVKDYLVTQQLPPERLFLGAVKTTASDEKWTPRAELNLDAR